MANMKKKMPARKKVEPVERGGFTIIEVVLVLAIAGLIFLMVFIALPALQRSQRDTQRRDDMARVTEAITKYQTNNNGRLPRDGYVQAYDEIENAKDIKLADWCTGTTSTGTGSGVNSSAACLIKRYIAGVNDELNTFSDPDGYTYGLTIETVSPGVTGLTPTSSSHVDDYNSHTIVLYTHARCGEDETVDYSSNARDYAVMYLMEGSGTYCQDNG